MDFPLPTSHFPLPVWQDCISVDLIGQINNGIMDSLLIPTPMSRDICVEHVLVDVGVSLKQPLVMKLIDVNRLLATRGQTYISI